MEEKSENPNGDTESVWNDPRAKYVLVFVLALVVGVIIGATIGGSIAGTAAETASCEYRDILIC
ncbi:MAG: hypothetical protein SV760_09395 [Halobacteria archaeon]|nr:hypothetical protein [Halobacteria archaeon]